MTLLLAALGACAPEPEAAASPFVPLEPRRLARRVSIDLRGVAPTLEELETAEASGVDALVDQWLYDPRFEGRIADVYAEAWSLHSDQLRITPAEFGFGDDETYAFRRAFEDEPARLAARIVAEDRPWTDIVTADTTMANDLLASMVDVEWVDPAETGEWREARYLDGRPPLGVLATAGLWVRYPTTLFNYNRGRAAVLSQLLLCHDVLGRPVPFAATEGSSNEELAAAIGSQTGCVACHAGLDPLASALFGFYPYEDKDGTEIVTYHPERERAGVLYTGVEPAWAGTPVDGVAALGPLIASDPRFPMCTARRAAEQLWGRTTDLHDTAEVVALRDTLQAEGRYRSLLAAVIATPEYRAGALVADATAEQLERHRTVRLQSPLTLRSTVEDLTGFHWTWSGWDELDSDETGYRLLLGGADGDLVRVPSYRPSLSRTLVLRRLAQTAARTVVDADLAAPSGDRRLFSGLDLLDPTDAELDAELGRLSLRVLATDPDEARLGELRQVYQDVAAVSDPPTAWASVVSLLLRDPEFWTY